MYDICIYAGIIEQANMHSSNNTNCNEKL